MSVLLAALTVAGAAWLAIALWARLPPDLPHARAPRVATGSGVQGWTARWLATGADLRAAPADEEGVTWSPTEDRRPVERAIQAILHRLQQEQGLKSRDEALRRLRQGRLSPAARHALAGRLGSAARACARSTYSGPPSLFLAWYWLVLVPRHGPRRLRAATAHAILSELRDA